jgi:hypothetical protein
LPRETAGLPSLYPRTEQRVIFIVDAEDVVEQTFG